ncbi:hypothetical protein LZ30DRAFT_775185 [Colletotrichum cereale]|nr:hypothetical protein LZ30DRAFT_775185 [Colletotrichum cereale]
MKDRAGVRTFDRGVLVFYSYECATDEDDDDQYLLLYYSAFYSHLPGPWLDTCYRARPNGQLREYSYPPALAFACRKSFRHGRAVYLPRDEQSPYGQGHVVVVMLRRGSVTNTALGPTLREYPAEVGPARSSLPTPVILGDSTASWVEELKKQRWVGWGHTFANVPCHHNKWPCSFDIDIEFQLPTKMPRYEFLMAHHECVSIIGASGGGSSHFHSHSHSRVHCGIPLIPGTSSQSQEGGAQLMEAKASLVGASVLPILASTHNDNGQVICKPEASLAMLRYNDPARSS